MPDIQFGGSDTISNSGNFPISSPGLTPVAGQVMASGSTAILITHLASFAGGFSAPINVQVQFGSAITGSIGVNATSTPQATGYQPVTPWLVDGGSYSIYLWGSDRAYFYRGGGSGTTSDSTGPFPGASTLLVAYRYVQAPTAPGLSVSGGIATGSVVVTTSAPGSTGGSAITGYRIEYADNALFAGTQSQNISAGSTTITGLSTGKTWYFRLAAHNAVTTTASTWSIYSSTASIFLVAPTFDGEIRTSYGIAVTDADISYVSDVSNNNVQIFDANGQYTSKWGISGTGDGQFAAPRGVALDSSNNVYVADSGNNRIQKFTSAGVFSAKWGTTGSGNTNMNSPYDIAINGANVYLTDSANNRVVRYNASGTYQSQWGTLGTGNTNMNAPRGITTDVAGNVYVVDYGNNRVVKYNSTGTYLAQFTGFLNPQDVIVDAASNIWVSDTGNNRLMKLDGSGNLVSTISIYPQPLMLDVNNNKLYITLNNTGTRSDKVVVLSINGPTLSDAIQYYVALSSAELVVDYQASENPIVTLPPFSGNIWDHLKQLCSAYGVEIYASGTTITVQDIGLSELVLDNVKADSVNLSLSSRSSGLAVEYTNQNAYSGSGNAFTATSIYQIGVAEQNTITVQTNHFLLTVLPPEPTDSYTNVPGTYNVVDSLGIHVPLASWNSYGGSITASLDPTNPQNIILNFTGPVAEIPGFVGPYSFSTLVDAVKVGALGIIGFGLFTNPKTVKIYTGADRSRTSREIAFSVDNFAHSSLAMIYKRASFTQSNASGPEFELNAVVPTKILSGFGLTPGCVIFFKESKYRLNTVNISGDWATIKASRFALAADFDELWSVQTVGDFDAFWSGYIAGDVKVRPLRSYPSSTLDAPYPNTFYPDTTYPA